MPIQPIQYQPTTQFQPVNSFLSTYATVKQMQAAKDEMESAKMRNRLYAMQLKEAETNQAFKNELANSLLAPQTVKDITLTQPAQLSQVPLQSPGGVLATQQRTPSGGISENTPAAPIVAPAQTLKMTGLTGEIPPEMTGTPGVLADIQERQIIPLIEQAKQFGIPEAAVRGNPSAALEFIEKKKAENQAVLDKKITMVKNLAAVNPKMAESLWNSDPQLKAMGAFEAQTGGRVEYGDDGKPIGRWVTYPGATPQFVKEGMTDYQAARLEQDAFFKQLTLDQQRELREMQLEMTKQYREDMKQTREQYLRLRDRVPATLVDNLAEMKTTYDRLGGIKEKMEDPKFKHITGPIAGRWNKLKIKFVKDGYTQEVSNELNSMITIAYSLSGKQISYREMELLREAMLPRLEQPDENLGATIDFARDWLANTHNDKLQYYEEGGYSTRINRLKTRKDAAGTGKPSGGNEKPLPTF